MLGTEMHTRAQVCSRLGCRSMTARQSPAVLLTTNVDKELLRKETLDIYRNTTRNRA